MRFSADQFDKARISYQRFPGIIRGITPGGATFSVNVDDNGFMHLAPQRSAAHRALISALQGGNEGDDAVGPYKPSIYGA